MFSLFHLLIPFDLLKICDNHQGNPRVLMPQIREFSTNCKVLENSLGRRETGAHRSVNKGAAQLRCFLDFQSCSAADL